MMLRALVAACIVAIGGSFSAHGDQDFASNFLEEFDQNLALAEALGEASSELALVHDVFRHFDVVVAEDGIASQYLFERRAEFDARVRAILMGYSLEQISASRGGAGLLADLILISGDAELAANALEHIRPMAESGQFHSRYFQTLENRVSALAESSLSSASTELGSHSADTWREVIRSIAELNPTARSIGRVSGRDEWSRDLIVAWMREPAHASALNEIMPVISQALDDTIDAPNAHDVLSTVDSAGFARLMEFTPSLAARAVSIIQHAGETEQQAAVLDWIEPHALAGTFDGQAYALLFDRVAKAQGRPQRYGTQDACAADGSRIPYMLEDATRVDEWREQMDLMPLDDYFRVHNENMGPCQ